MFGQRSQAADTGLTDVTQRPCGHQDLKRLAVVKVWIGVRTAGYTSATADTQGPCRPTTLGNLLSTSYRADNERIDPEMMLTHPNCIHRR